MTWEIVEGFQPAKKVDFGNKFLLANGYMGYRGTLEEDRQEDLVANTLLGLYDQVGDKWREPVNAPNALYFAITKPDLSLKSCPASTHKQVLNLKAGLHQRNTVYEVGDNLITLTAERFLSMAQVHLLVQKIKITVTEAITLTFSVGIDGQVWDINGPHLADFAYEKAASCLLLSAVTQESQKMLAVGQEIYFPELVNQPSFELIRDAGVFMRQYRIAVTPEEPLIMEVFGATYNDNDLENPVMATRTAVAEAKKAGYQALFTAHCKVWDELWAQADVVIEGDSEAQLALRYSIYHLLSIAPRHSDQVSIPARGLSGQTYKGAVFWDTEMFMLPFYMRTLPEVARNLLLYRVHTLPGALAKAASYGFEGAFYAWESQEGGFDATSDYNITDVFTKRPMRTYFKDKQIHISGDIAYAIWEYVKNTGDASLLFDGGAEVIFQCAAFYVSYGYYKSAKERYELIDVIGPDEYHERVYNNAYTNKIAQETVTIALELWAVFEEEQPGFLTELLAKTDLAGQRSIWQDFVMKLYLQEADEEGLIEQFDGYFQLEDTSVATVRARLLDDKEYWGGAYGVAADTQIIKQADVILLLQLFGDEYPLAVLQKNWEYYEPRTEHGSSLSACLYALVACRFGNQDWAYPYFMKTATVDLSGESKQYAGTIYIGGTHPAANGGAWMTAILGFAGLKEKNGQLSLLPHLPQSWQKLQFKTRYQGKQYQVIVTPKQSEISELY